MKNTIYSMILCYRDREKKILGTVSALAEYVSYTLICGNSWNPKIRTADRIKTIKQLESAYNKSIDETQGNCFHRDYGFFKEATQEETSFFFKNYDGDLNEDTVNCPIC